MADLRQRRIGPQTREWRRAMADGVDPRHAGEMETLMLRTCFLTTAMLAFSVAPALAQSETRDPPTASSRSTAPVVGVVVDPDTRTAVVVPLNPRADVPPEVTATLEALYRTGKIQPGQIAEIVVQRGNHVTQVISNTPTP
jgi:hypothetical protein